MPDAPPVPDTALNAALDTMPNATPIATSNTALAAASTAASIAATATAPTSRLYKGRLPSVNVLEPNLDKSGVWSNDDFKDPKAKKKSFQNRLDHFLKPKQARLWEKGDEEQKQQCAK